MLVCSLITPYVVMLNQMQGDLCLYISEISWLRSRYFQPHEENTQKLTSRKTERIFLKEEKFFDMLKWVFEEERSHYFVLLGMEL